MTDRHAGLSDAPDNADGRDDLPPRPASTRGTRPGPTTPAAEAGVHLHLRPRYLAAVLAGGAIGTVLRHLATSRIPHTDGLPLPTFVVNMSGAFLLGVLLQRLAAAGPDEGWLRLLRLHLGTGVLGAFTTYSSFVLEAVLMAESGRLAAAVTYAAATLLLGVTVCALGVRVAGQGS